MISTVSSCVPILSFPSLGSVKEAMHKGDFENMVATAVVFSPGLAAKVGTKIFCSTVPMATAEGLASWYFLTLACSRPTGQMGKKEMSIPLLP